MSSPWGIPDSWATPIDGSNELSLAKQRADIQHLGASTDHLRALTQRDQIGAAREGMQLSLQMKRMKELEKKSGQAVVEGDSMEGQLQRMADDEYAMGNPDKAARVLSQLAQVKNHKAQASLANEKLNEVIKEKEYKRKEDMYNIFSGVNSKEDFQQAMMIVRGKYPDQQIPEELSQYSPAVVDYLKKFTKVGLERAKAQQSADREANVDRRHEENLKAARQNLEFREREKDQRQRYGQDRQDARRKVAGTKPAAAGLPDQTMIKAADALVRRDFPNLPGEVSVGKDMVSSAAYDVASEAKALMAANRGLSSSEAMNRVYTQLKKSGAFRTETEKGFFTDKTKNIYSRPTNVQKDQAKPAPLPPRGTALEDGKIYDKGDGTLFKWDAKKGKGIVVPGGSDVPGAAEVVQNAR